MCRVHFRPKDVENSYGHPIVQHRLYREIWIKWFIRYVCYCRLCIQKLWHSVRIKLIKLYFVHWKSNYAQITDWLNLDQNMAKNYLVDVGDHEAITEAISKQKVSNSRKEFEKFKSFEIQINFNAICDVFRLLFANWK